MLKTTCRKYSNVIYDKKEIYAFIAQSLRKNDRGVGTVKIVSYG